MVGISDFPMTAANNGGGGTATAAAAAAAATAAAAGNQVGTTHTTLSLKRCGNLLLQETVSEPEGHN